MDEAWVCYYPDSGKIASIGWERSDGPSVAVPVEMAAKLMSGEIRKSSYRVVNRGDGPMLELFQPITSMPKFWSLMTIDEEESNMEVRITDVGIEVRIPDSTIRSCLIFATLKNDPSWLIETWDLRDFKMDNGMIKIPYPDADQYSVYIRKINEA